MGPHRRTRNLWDRFGLIKRFKRNPGLNVDFVGDFHLLFADTLAICIFPSLISFFVCVSVSCHLILEIFVWLLIVLGVEEW